MNEQLSLLAELQRNGDGVFDHLSDEEFQAALDRLLELPKVATRARPCRCIQRVPLTYRDVVAGAHEVVCVRCGRAAP